MQKAGKSENALRLHEDAELDRAPTILVVDDSDVVRAMFRDLLEAEGYRVHTLACGNDVVPAVTTNPPDLVLLDIRMPGVGGLEVLEILQHRNETRDIPVIMVTACDAPHDVAYALNSGATDYIVKPCSEAIVKARVQATLRAVKDRSRLADENQELQQQITDRANSEKELWISKQRYTNAALAGKVGPWEWNIKTDEIYLATGMQAMLGLSLEDLPPTMSQWMQRIPDDGRYHFKAALNSHIDGFAKQFEAVVQMSHKDGRVFWLLARGEIEKDARGVPERMLGAMTDITDLKRAEQSWSNNESWSRAVLENAVDGIINCDVKGIVKTYNTAAARIFGYPPEEVVGRNVSILVPQPDAQRHDEHLQGYLQTGQSKIVGIGREVEARRKDGSLVLVHIAVSEVHLGEERGFTAMVRDLSERERTNRELLQAKLRAEAADRAKSEFLANMSHEIRTPLNAIMGFSHLLLKDDPPHNQEEKRDFLQTINSSGEHLLEVINDILDFSKIEAGSMEARCIDTSLDELIGDVVSMLRVRAREKNLSLDVSYRGQLPKTILTDPAKLRQLLLNLVGNAIKFTEIGGVELTVQLTEESKLLVDVSDTGIGIPEEKFDAIFNPFIQVDGTATRSFGGTGLGLAISHRIAELLDGTLSVCSQVGKGSVFSLEVPVGSLEGVEMLNEPLTKDRQVTEDEASTLEGHILVVEDGDSNRKLFRLTLEHAGASVTVAENGQVGVDAALRESFDLILMDMQMPVLDGYQATRKIREAGLKTPIIAITAHALKDDQDKCLEAGCTGYLTKPIEGNQLVAIVAAELEEYRGSQHSQKTSQARSEQLVSTLPLEDPDFLEIVEEYLQTLQEKIAAMRSTWKENDMERLKELAHWLKGAGGTAGFAAFTKPATELEHWAAEGNTKLAATAIAEIADLADRIVLPSTEKIPVTR